MVNHNETIDEVLLKVLNKHQSYINTDTVSLKEYGVIGKFISNLDDMYINDILNNEIMLNIKKDISIIESDDDTNMLMEYLKDIYLTVCLTLERNGKNIDYLIDYVKSVNVAWEKELFNSNLPTISTEDDYDEKNYSYDIISITIYLIKLVIEKDKERYTK
jgi:hypothetical protein